MNAAKIENAVRHVQEVLHVESFGIRNLFAVDEIKKQLATIRAEGGDDVTISEKIGLFLTFAGSQGDNVTAKL